MADEALHIARGCPQVSEILQGPKGKETSVGTSGLTGGGPGTRETARMAPDQVREFSSTAGGIKPLAEVKEQELAPEEAAWGREEHGQGRAPEEAAWGREEHGQGRAGTRVMAGVAVGLGWAGAIYLVYVLQGPGAGKSLRAHASWVVCAARRRRPRGAWSGRRARLHTDGVGAR
jgi:hypothetical protein